MPVVREQKGQPGERCRVASETRSRARVDDQGEADGGAGSQRQHPPEKRNARTEPPVPGRAADEPRARDGVHRDQQSGMEDQPGLRERVGVRAPEGHPCADTSDQERHKEKSQQAAMGRVEVVPVDRTCRHDGGEEVQQDGTADPPEEEANPTGERKRGKEFAKILHHHETPFVEEGARVDIMRSVSAVVRPVYRGSRRSRRHHASGKTSGPASVRPAIQTAAPPADTDDARMTRTQK